MKPNKIYAEHLEQTAIDQFESAMEQDFVIRGALMPDSHAGYSLPIGAVVATDNIVVPAWVGYDIGCGMCAVRTSFNVDEVRKNSKAIFDQIYRDVPVGFKHNSQPENYESELPFSSEMEQVFKDGCPSQLGTLGGGNHFIEIGSDETDDVWIITHSGSRNIGHKTASHYMRQASKLHTGIEKAKEGHYGFQIDSDLGQDYLTDLDFCLAFALANRKKIISRCVDAIAQYVPGEAEWDELINRNHNHAEMKNGMMIHRKGATHAEEGMMGVIPGNMRDGSFIVRGKGNPDSLWSSSHGAGRVLGRKKAKEILNISDFKDTMRGVQALVTENTLDESPYAYKDIFQVMKLQSELVEVVRHVSPIINIKG